MDITLLLTGLSESIIYSILWILLMVLCYIVIDKMTVYSIKKEIIDDENISLGIMFAGFFIAIAIIIAAAIK